jgi:hypothetical protein
MPLIIDDDDDEKTKDTFPDAPDENEDTTLSLSTNEYDGPEVLLEDHHGLEADDGAMSLEEAADAIVEPVITTDPDGNMRLGEIGDLENDNVPPAEVKKEIFLRAKLPPPEELEGEKEIAGKPRIFLGEFCIVLMDSRNFATYVWSAEKPTRGRFTEKVITKFRFLGYSSTFPTVVKGIRQHLEQTVLSVANNRHLADAIEYLKHRDKELLAAARDIRPEHFLKKDGEWYVKSLIEGHEIQEEKSTVPTVESEQKKTERRKKTSRRKKK